MKRELVIEWLPAATLIMNPRNARKHLERQLRQIGTSIREFGFTNPMLVDENNRLIAGHGRLSAARKLGMEEVPVIRLAGLTEPQKRALALADNKLAENASWDIELLGQELKVLAGLDLNLDITVTGFEPAEIDILIEGLEIESKDDKGGQVPAVDLAAKPVTQIGDLWRLGNHAVLCGDARDAAAYTALVGDDKVRHDPDRPALQCGRAAYRAHGSRAAWRFPGRRRGAG